MKKLTITKRDRSLVAEWLTDRIAELEPDAEFIEDERPGLMAALRRLLEELER